MKQLNLAPVHYKYVSSSCPLHVFGSMIHNFLLLSCWYIMVSCNSEWYFTVAHGEINLFCFILFLEKGGLGNLGRYTLKEIFKKSIKQSYSEFLASPERRSIYKISNLEEHHKEILPTLENFLHYAKKTLTPLKSLLQRGSSATCWETFNII